jgi:D-amino-acid dehydrogenase
MSEVLIIGGGVIGVCTAYELAKRGAKVSLIEQGEIGSGASYGNGGLIVPSHCVPLAAPGVPLQGLKWMFNPESPFYIKPHFSFEFLEWMLLFAYASRRGPMMRALPVLSELLLSSRKIFDEIAKEGGFPFGYEQKGTLAVFLTQRALDKGLEEAHLVGGFGVETRSLNGTELCELEPALRAEVAGGIHYPQDAHIDPAGFVIGLAEKARELGVRILTHTEVMRFETEGRKINQVQTTRGDFTADQVILCAGAWSPAVLRELEINLPIQAAKGYSITLETPEISPSYPLMFGEARVVVTPFKESLRLAGTLELAGMDFSIQSRRVDAIRTNSAKYLQGLENAKVTEIWRGLRPCTPDGLPVVSRAKQFDNLIVAAGHAMLGMSLGPITGKLTSQLALGEDPEMDLAPLRLERF